ncbi:ATP-binding protein [Aerosakkonema funiforme]|uniref:Anti-sigma regulatory factor n=2 Tax=Oscillatoriophycideae TaxID=1301283 RepID=A0A926VB01_9CYAN|nr:ATP-binding protein [Aerosakkonema funiforme]MBD2180063.1 anti-sigma regulatory factor [Aerosakkonema funiforme FACHB-1375]
MLKKIHLQVNTDLTASGQVLSWFEQLNHPPIRKEIWWQCQTLLQEGFANIVEHAHKDLPPDTPIDIEAVRFDEHIEIRIYSYGPDFDLEAQLAQTPKLEDNFEGRGRGLKIISLLADYFTYKSADERRNCLLMSKQY